MLLFTVSANSAWNITHNDGCYDKAEKGILIKATRKNGKFRTVKVNRKGFLLTKLTRESEKMESMFCLLEIDYKSHIYIYSKLCLKYIAIPAKIEGKKVIIRIKLNPDIIPNLDFEYDQDMDCVFISHSFRVDLGMLNSIATFIPFQSHYVLHKVFSKVRSNYRHNITSMHNTTLIDLDRCGN